MLAGVLYGAGFFVPDFAVGGMWPPRFIP